MALVVVGGHSRNIGKTSVAAGLISALPEYGWTAIKLTVCKPFECPVNGPGCSCPDGEHKCILVEESNCCSPADSGRLLAAGARRAFWGRVKAGGFDVIIPRIREIIAGAEQTIVESNSLVQHVRPDLYITVVNPFVPDWKASARELLDKADAVLLTGAQNSSVALPRDLQDAIARTPQIRAVPPDFAPRELVGFVRHRLGPPGGGPREAL